MSTKDPDRYRRGIDITQHIFSWVGEWLYYFKWGFHFQLWEELCMINGMPSYKHWPFVWLPSSCVPLLWWETSVFKKQRLEASLVVQWLRIHLPMQGTWVRALVREDPTCHGATKPVCHNYWACALEPTNHNYWSPRSTTTEAHTPRVRALPQEKPLQWEARTLQQRVDPACRN